MKQFLLRMSKDMHEYLREESFITNKSMTEIIIEVLEKHIKTDEAKKEGTRCDIPYTDYSKRN